MLVGGDTERGVARFYLDCSARRAWLWMLSLPLCADRSGAALSRGPVVPCDART